MAVTGEQAPTAAGEAPEGTPVAESQAARGDEAETAAAEGEAAALARAKEAEDRLLRIAAEFENYKKRMERERANALKYAEEGIVRELLPTLDNLDRAIEQGQASGNCAGLLEGVEMTRSGLMQTLERYGLVPLESAGKPFDPNFHEALTMEASDSVPAQSIVKEYFKGYMYKERLLRAAKVIVSSGKAA